MELYLGHACFLPIFAQPYYPHHEYDILHPVPYPWNGTPLPEVVPSRGVRQGDPLSPYLFILCLERLSLKLEEAVRDKLLYPISFRGQVRLSHLFFADDIFLFTHAKTKDCTKLNHILHQFCAASGQLVSVSKSRLWFSPNTS